MTTEMENRLLELSLAGDIESVKAIVENEAVQIDCQDKTGMTPLQQAAFRGNHDLCSYLLNKGADVNWDGHENQYTTLMFAGLSGNEECVRLLLDAGAKVDPVNSVNRTAAEMAAFVSQYHIAGVINNFLPSSELTRFTKPSGENREKIRADLLQPLHKILNDPNINPVHLLMKFNEIEGITEEAVFIRRALDVLVLEKMNPHNTQEAQAIKLHYISELLMHMEKAGGPDILMKKLSLGRGSDGFLIHIEELLRSTLRSFPRSESNLLRMMVSKLSGVTIGDHPTALQTFYDSINGAKIRSEDDKNCELCTARNSKQCQGCLKVHYCSKECQKLHRKSHKKYCVK